MELFTSISGTDNNHDHHHYCYYYAILSETIGHSGKVFSRLTTT